MSQSIPNTLAWILTLLSVVVSTAQDPVKVERAKPSLGEYPLPPKQKPNPPPLPLGPDAIRDLDINKVRLFWVEDYASTVPVRWTVTPLDPFALADVFEVGAKPVFIMQGDVRAKVHDVPAGAKSAIQVWGVSKGRVLIQADGVKDNAIVTLVKFTIDVGGPQSPQPPPEGGEPPIVVPPVKPLKGYFLNVRPDGPASQEFAKAFALPAWKELVAEGHTVKEMTLTESLQYYKAPAGTEIPFTVTIDPINKKVIAGPVAMPKTDDAIRKLREGVK